MRVVATKLGFYNGSRVAAGTTFEMTTPVDPPKGWKLPKWVLPATPANVAKAQGLTFEEANKQARGAIAASGGKAAEKKQVAFNRELHGAKASEVDLTGGEGNTGAGSDEPLA